MFFGNNQLPDSAVDLMNIGEVSVSVPTSILPGVYTVTVVNRPDNKESNTDSVTILTPLPRFIRGDANLDEVVEIGDAVRILLHTFVQVSATCEEAMDVDDNGALDQTDAIRVLEYVFRNGDEPPTPFSSCGTDTDGDALGCEAGLLDCF